MSLTFSVLIAMLAVRFGAAAPTGGAPPQCPSVSVVANFEDVTTLPLVNVNPIPTPYNGLFYQAITADNVINTGVTPLVIPHSGTKVARTSAQTETTAGTPMLTVNYPVSNVTAFTLRSFYFGCVLSAANAAAAPPMQCLVELTGYQGNDNQVSNARQVCSQQFQYNPSTMTGPQQLAFSGPVADCFQDTQFVIVQFGLPGGTAVANPDLVLDLDDIAYSYRKKC